MGKYQVAIEGITPLLMHQDQIDDEAIVSSPGNTKKGDDRAIDGKWKQYLYLADGHVVMPADNVMAALMRAGAKIKTGGMATLKAVSQLILLDDPWTRLHGSKGKITESSIMAVQGRFDEQAASTLALGFDLFVKRCKIGKARHVRVRPRFHTWSFTMGFDVDDEKALPLATLQLLFNTAGRLSGLGDWRPSAPTPGPYGRFSATVSLA